MQIRFQLGFRLYKVPEFQLFREKFQPSLAAADRKLQEYFAFERKYSRCVLALISIIWQTLDLQILV